MNALLKQLWTRHKFLRKSNKGTPNSLAGTHISATCPQAPVLVSNLQIANHKLKKFFYINNFDKLDENGMTQNYFYFNRKFLSL